MSDLEALLGAAEAAIQAGQFDQAENLYLQAGREQQSARQLNGLAVIAAKRGQYQVALGLFDRARTVEPDNLDAWLNAGNIRRALGDRAAERDFREALALDGNNLQAHMGLGLCLQELGKLEEAHRHLGHVLKMQPGTPGVGKLAARLAFQLGKLSEARAHLEAALALDKGDPELLVLKAQVLKRESLYWQALEILDGVDTEGALQELADTLRAGCLVDSAQVEAALAFCEEASQRHPGKADLFAAQRIKALQVDGQIERARVEAQAACQQWPTSASLWHQLALLAPQDVDDDAVATIESLFAEAPKTDRVLLAFSLAAICEARKDYAGELRWLDAGNNDRRLAPAYDYSLQQRAVEFLTQQVLEPLPPAGDGHPAKPRPIFIIGMPRSGTTLTEQILSSHSTVAAGGESALVREVLKEWEQQEGLSGFNQMLSERLDELTAFVRRRLTEAFSRLADGAPVLTEKSVNNFLYVPILAGAFPEASFVWVRRHPLDNCFGCYKQLFGDGQEFSYYVDGCAWHYAMTDTLMHHWRDTVGIELHELRYEDLVADLDTATRSLLQHCGLAFEEACVQFHQNRRRVVTASVGQVRQGMFSGAMGRWQRYGALLDPFRGALERHGVDVDAYPLA